MENTKNIIETLIAQHRVLQNDLGGALELSEIENPNISEIDSCLKKFLLDLPEHLSLENETFYPELLTQMENKKMDTSKTKAFIEEMNVIGVAVIAFTDKYKNESLIKDQFNDFKKELVNIISVLNTRIESEESGVYLYWN